MGALKELTPAITALLSISFLVLTFFLGQYENNKFEPAAQREPYYYAIWFVNSSILFSTISLLSSISVYIGCSNFIATISPIGCIGGVPTIGLVALAISVGSLLMGVFYLNYKVLI